MNGLHSPLRCVHVLVSTALVLGCSYEPAQPPQSSKTPAAPSPAGLPARPSASAGEPRAPVPRESAPPSLALPGAEAAIPAWVGKDKDEPFDVRQFLEGRAAPPDNAAPWYLTALAEVDSNLLACVYPRAEWERRGGAARSLEEKINNLLLAGQGRRGLYSYQGLPTGDFPTVEIEQCLSDAKTAFERLDQAQNSTRCVFITSLRLPVMTPHAQAARVFARLEVIQIAHARAKGGFEEAEQAVRRTLRLSRDLRPRGDQIVQLVSVAMDGLVLGAISDFVLAQPGLETGHCDRLMALLVEHGNDPVSGLAEGVRTDYVIHRNTLDAMERGQVNLGELRYFGINTKMIEATLASGKVNWQDEIAACNRVFAVALARIALPRHQLPRTPWANEVQAVVSPSKAPIMRVLLEPGATLNYDGLRDGDTRNQATLAGTQCLVAVRRYFLAHRAVPPDLQTAAREAGLSAVPTDPFSGQPMRYRVLDGKPVIYSVGRDRRDDGGVMDSRNQERGDLIFRLNAR